MILLALSLVYYSVFVSINISMIRGATNMDVTERGILSGMGYGLFYGLAFIFPAFSYFIKYRKKIDLHLFVLYCLFMIIIIFALIQAQFVTAFLAAITFSIFSFFNTRSMKTTFFIMIPFMVIISFLMRGFADEIMNFIASFMPEGYLQRNLIDFGETLSSANILDADTYMATVRLAMFKDLWFSFLAHPFFGGIAGNGHLFWLNTLSFYGLFGFLPWAVVITQQVLLNLRNIDTSYKNFYMTSMLCFITVGVFKGGIIGWHTCFLLFIFLPNFNQLSYYLFKECKK
jgi:hypothetical protein